MKLGIGGSGEGQGKKTMLLAVLLIVVIAGAGFFVFRTMMGSSGGDYASPEGAPMSMPMPGAPPGSAPPPPDGTLGPGPGGAAPPPGSTAGQPGPAGPAAPAPATAPASNAPAPTGQPQPAKPAASAPTPPKPSTRASKPEPKVEMKQMTVFGTVSVSYPASWKITAGSGNNSAVFTDGSACFEVHPPDPKAKDAKTIAASAMKTLAKGAVALSQGMDKISGYDTYWIAAKQGGRTIRVVGVDAPTRVALVEYVKNGQFSAYRDVFNKMQSGMSFRGM